MHRQDDRGVPVRADIAPGLDLPVRVERADHVAGVGAVHDDAVLERALFLDRAVGGEVALAAGAIVAGDERPRQHRLVALEEDAAGPGRAARGGPGPPRWR